MLNRLELGQYKEDTIGLFSNCRAFSLAYTVIEKARELKKKTDYFRQSRPSFIVLALR